LVTREEVRKRVGERELCIVVVQFGLVRKEIFEKLLGVM
jgi:hypothetical protein